MSGPIFIGGTGRSGTTVLVRLLAHHPSIFTVRWESQFLVAPGGLIHLTEKGLRPGHLDAFEERMRGRWYRRLVRPGKEGGYEAGLLADVTEPELERALGYLREAAREPGERTSWEIARAFTDLLFAPATERAGARRWCEKTPRNVLFVEELLRIFPDMRFLHIIRDGRDVVASMKARGFWPIAPGHEFPELAPFRGRVTAAAAARYWVTVLDLARRLTAEVPADHYLELRLEDLVCESREMQERICTFLGEPFDERLSKQNLGRSHSGRWREDLTPAEIAEVESIAGEALAREGYS